MGRGEERTGVQGRGGEVRLPHCKFLYPPVFKMSAFYTDTYCQPMSPLISSNVNNVPLGIFTDTPWRN